MHVWIYLDVPSQHGQSRNLHPSVKRLHRSWHELQALALTL